MIATFDNTLGILVKAYLDGVLERGGCAACAVGNICAAAIGEQVIDRFSWAGSVRPRWSQVFATVGNQMFWPEKYGADAEATRQIDATGYTWQQLAAIEKAFETAPGDELDGLMAVVDVLADIHGIDLATAEVAKGLFVRC